ncbi:MAG: MGMT family protein [Lapillicoccus sp.]
MTSGTGDDAQGGPGSRSAAGLPDKAEDVLEVVARIPEGKVATYGDVAEMVGGRGPRFVGNVLSRYGSDVPWWRVVRAGGHPPQGLEDQALGHYRDEGTPLVALGGGTTDGGDGFRIDLTRARWEPALSAGFGGDPPPVVTAPRGTLHHVEVWVAHLGASRASWGWLLRELGYRREDEWPTGETWQLGATYVVLEAGPDMRGAHERTRAGVNHLAFHAGTRTDVDRLVTSGGRHGWSLMFADRHPYAGGPGHYAAYLEDASGFEVELVAR